MDHDARFIEVSASDRYTCGRRIDGSIRCWDHWNEHVPWEWTGRYSSVTTASTYACGRAADASPSCRTLNAEHPVPDEAAAADFVQISDSGYHTCVLRPDGTLPCWGDDDVGEAATPPAGHFTRISAGVKRSYAAPDPRLLAHTCGVRQNGAIECWGDNSLGQSDPPIGDDFITVAASGVHACGLRRDGSIECWGQELRYGRPLRATGRYTDVVVGAGHGPHHEEDDGTIWYPKHVCGLRIDGIVECWGSTYSPNKPYNRTEPDSRSRFTSISSGSSRVCGVRTDGAIECWGTPAFIAY